MRRGVRFSYLVDLGTDFKFITGRNLCLIFCALYSRSIGLAQIRNWESCFYGQRVFCLAFFSLRKTNTVNCWCELETRNGFPGRSPKSCQRQTMIFQRSADIDGVNGETWENKRRMWPREIVHAPRSNDLSNWKTRKWGITIRYRERKSKQDSSERVSLLLNEITAGGLFAILQPRKANTPRWNVKFETTLVHPTHQLIFHSTVRVFTYCSEN